MKKEKKLKIAAIAAAVAVAGTVTVYAAYDSAKDPIVSLSYLEEVFGPSLEATLNENISAGIEGAMGELSGQIKTEVSSAVEGIKDEVLGEVAGGIDGSLSETVADLESQIAALESDISETASALQAQLDALTNVYEVVNLKAGGRIIADASCEIIVISGNAIVRCTDSTGGLIDCSDGVLLYDGQSVPLYHKLLVPENGDGRGIAASGATQVLVRGGYTLA